MDAALGFLVRTKEKFLQVVRVVIDDKDDIASFSPVATIRSALGDVLFTAEAGATVSAVAGFGKDSYVIDKHSEGNFAGSCVGAPERPWVISSIAWNWPVENYQQMEATTGKNPIIRKLFTFCSRAASKSYSHFSDDL